MLSAQDNDYLCRIGPGTPMGNMFRQYWIPAVRSDELPSPDCPPLRIKLLGEELISFRTTSGAVGLIQNACPHRGASLFFGRNEEEGLRCVYHGWKFDTAGACADMPSEPAESNFRSKVKAKAYPTNERNGIVWAYMGPRAADNLPSLPDMEANLLSKEPEKISVMQRRCNWMQGLEGELDTVHAAFLHWGADKPEAQEPKSFLYYHFTERRNARFVAKDTESGCAYGAYRPAEEDTYYWRTGLVFFPFYAMQAQGELGPEVKMNAYVPIDDDHTMQWEIFVRTDGKPRREAKYPIVHTESESVINPRGAKYVPHTSGWYGRFDIDQNPGNDYQVDREVQKSWGSYSGIRGIRQQDMAVTESMGPIYQRDHEHLGTSDSMIIRTRRRWINQARALEQQGIIPPGVEDPTLYRRRSGEVILPRSVDWWDGTHTLRHLWEADKELEEVQAIQTGGS